MADCRKCAGTGDLYDTEKDAWAKPQQDCPACKGWGQIDE